MKVNKTNRIHLLFEQLKTLEKNLRSLSGNGDSTEINALRAAKLIEPFKNLLDKKTAKKIIKSYPHSILIRTIKENIPYKIKRQIFLPSRNTFSLEISKRQLSQFLIRHNQIEKSCLGGEISKEKVPEITKNNKKLKELCSENRSLTVSKTIIALKRKKIDLDTAINILNQYITPPKTNAERAILKKTLKPQLGTELYKTLKPKLDCMKKEPIVLFGLIKTTYKPKDSTKRSSRAKEANVDQSRNRRKSNPSKQQGF